MGSFKAHFSLVCYTKALGTTALFRIPWFLHVEVKTQVMNMGQPSSCAQGVDCLHVSLLSIMGKQMHYAFLISFWKKAKIKQTGEASKNKSNGLIKLCIISVLSSMLPYSFQWLGKKIPNQHQLTRSVSFSWVLKRMTQTYLPPQDNKVKWI